MSLKKRTFSAGRWTVTSALATSGLQIVQVAILARLLVPADFGLMAITASTIAILNLFTDLGLSKAIVHFEKISLNALHSLYWLNLLTGITLSTLFFITAPLIENVLRLNGLTEVLQSISPFFMLSALGQQFCALAEKQLRFSSLAINEIIAAVTGFLVAISIAVKGGGVYALVGATLASTAASSILAWARLSTGYRPRLHLKIAEARPYLNFGSYLVGESALSTLIRQVDVFVAGLFNNPASLGMFSLPRDLSLRVGMAINPIITRVGFPVMSRLQGDITALKSVYMQTLRMTASVNFPIYMALGLFSEEVVALLYGQQWKEATIYLHALAAWGLIRSTGNPVGSLLHAIGAVKRAFWWNAAQLTFLPFFYWAATNNSGLLGLTTVMVVIQIFLVPLMWFFLVRPSCSASFTEYLRQLATPLLLSSVAGLAAWLSTRNVPHGTLRLAIGCISGGIIYLGLCRMFNRQWFDAIWGLLNLPARRLS